MPPEPTTDNENWFLSKDVRATEPRVDLLWAFVDQFDRTHYGDIVDHFVSYYQGFLVTIRPV